MIRTGLKKVAEEVGFEPTELSFNGFQDRRLKPLGHSSALIGASYITKKQKYQAIKILNNKIYSVY
jgi:hypothetical protein